MTIRLDSCRVEGVELSFFSFVLCEVETKAITRGNNKQHHWDQNQQKRNQSPPTNQPICYSTNRPIDHPLIKLVDGTRTSNNNDADQLTGSLGEYSHDRKRRKVQNNTARRPPSSLTHKDDNYVGNLDDNDNDDDNDDDVVNRIGIDVGIDNNNNDDDDSNDAATRG